MSKRLISGFTVAILCVFILSGCTSEEEKNAIASFNSAVTIVETKNSELDLTIAQAEELVAENAPAFDETAIATLESAISAAKSEKKEIPEQPKELNEILSVTDELNSINYVRIIEIIDDAKEAYENSIKQLEQITAPTDAFIIECLETVEGITGMSAATEENDPNNQLGKQGGYTAQVYFSYELVDQAQILGNSIIDKGTDCGGSVEVYSTQEAANNRDTYLGAFDGGMFASGSHKVVGTVLVRTSNVLTASQQKDLESRIIDSLIELK